MKKGVLYTIGASIILIICFIAFVLPSSLSRATQQQEGLVFGKYNGKKISYEYGSDFTEFLSQYAQMYRNQGQDITSSNQYTIYSYAFNSTVVKYAQEDALKAAGYEVPQDSINLQLKNYFKDSDGKFSMKAYKQADPSYIDNLTKSIKASLYTGRYYDDYFGTTFGKKTIFGLKSPKAETEFLDSFGQEKRAFKMVTFDTGNYPEEEQLKYGKANPDKFTKYDMSIITVDDKDTANKVISRISKGQITFEDAVSEYSENNYSNTEGKLTSKYQYQIENILNDKSDISTLANLSVGSVSPVIQTTTGYSIFKANAATTQPDFENDEVKSTVSNYITSYESGIVEDYFIAQANMFKSEAAASSFDDACTKLGKEKKEVAPFPLNYGNTSVTGSVDTSIDGLRGADTNENFLTAAFKLKLNEYSEPLVVGDYVIVIQYTSSENSEINDDDKPTVINAIVNYDNDAAQDAITSSPYLENNFINTYYSNLL